MTGAAQLSTGSLRTWLRLLPWSYLIGGWAFAYVLGIAMALGLKRLGWWEMGAPWERSALIAANATASPVLDLILLILPLLGTNYTLAPIIAVVAVWLWRTGRRLIPLHLATVQLGSWFLNPLLKFTLQRPRPDLFELRGQYAFSAYPSGHSIAVVSVLGTVAYMIHRTSHGTWGVWLVAFYFLLNAYSRVYLGVHWPTDVIGGAIVGAVWLAATLRAFRGFYPPGSVKVE